MSPWKKAGGEKRWKIAAAKTSPWYTTGHICNTHHPKLSTCWEKSFQRHRSRRVGPENVFVNISVISCDALRWKLRRHNSCWIGRLFWVFESAPWGAACSIDTKKIEHKISLLRWQTYFLPNLAWSDERCKIQLLFSRRWTLLRSFECALWGVPVPLQLILSACYATHTIQATKDQHLN